MSATIFEFFDALDLFAGHTRERTVGRVGQVVDLHIREILSRMDWLASAAESLIDGQPLSQEFRREHDYLRRQADGAKVSPITVQRALTVLEQQVIDAHLAGIAAATSERESN